MPLYPVLSALLARASCALGLETVDAFPPGHRYARTRWNRAYFDIASDLSPEAMEQAICAAIGNTPLVFAHIVHPTPRMQQALLSIIHTRLRRACGAPQELVQLLIAAYASADTPEAMPGLRAAIAANAALDMPAQVRGLLDFLGRQHAAYGVVEG